MATKSVVRIDNTHPNLRYSGPWEAMDASSYDNLDSSAPTFRSTLHSLLQNGSFEFVFNGAEGVVGGTIAPEEQGGLPPAQRTITDIDPDVTCAIDGVEVFRAGRTYRADYPINNVVFCRWAATSGTHTLTVNVSYPERTDSTMTLPNAPFMLDYVQFTPSFAQRVDNETVGFPPGDPSIELTGTWRWRWGQNLYPETHDDGATVRTSFNGTGVLVQGVRSIYDPGKLPYPYDRILNPASATYLLDDQNPVTFAIQTRSNNDLEGHTFLEVTGLPYGVHNLTVTYHGDRTKLPFSVTQVLVYRDIEVGAADDADGGPPLVDSNGTTFKRVVPSPQAEKAVSQGATIGVTVCGVLLVMASLWGAWTVLRKRRRKEAEDENENVHDGPPVKEPTSFQRQWAPLSKTNVPSGTTTTRESHASPAGGSVHHTSGHSGDAATISPPPRLVEVVEHPPLYTPT